MNYNKCKEIVECTIADHLQNTTFDSRIKSGMSYVLQGGKRLRPIITLAILEKLLPDGWMDYKSVCLIPEFIHSSSLIIDDLPAFDNALDRRGQKCVHLVHGEGLAYLLTFNLVTEAVLIAHKQLPALKETYTSEEAYKKYEQQVHNIITNISGTKALGGQLLSTFHTSGNVNLKDMNKTVEKLSKEQICDILYKKTSSFFDIAVTIGWILGCGDLDQLDDIHKLSDILGLCYQIYDDFLDYDEDVNGENFSHNYVYHRGTETAYEEFIEYLHNLELLIQKLNLDCPVFDYIHKFMSEKTLQAYKKLVK